MSLVSRRAFASMSVLGTALLVSTSCAHPTTFVVDGPVGSDAKVVVEDRYYEPTDGRVVVPVQPGDEPVQWRIEQGTGGPVVGAGAVERTDIEWPVIVAGTCLAACGIPTCAFAGFLLANPAVPAVPLEVAFNNPAAALVSFQSPTWTTIPLMAGGAAIGALPLLLATIAQSPPDTVRVVAGPVVDAPASTPAAPPLPNPPPSDAATSAPPVSPEPASPEPASSSSLPSSSSSQEGNPAGPLLQNASGMSF